MTDLQQRPMMAGMVDVTAVPEAPPALAEAKPTPRQRWSVAVPWALVGILLLVLAAAVRLPAPAPEAAPPAATPAPDPVIDVRTSEGLSDGATVWRDAAGQVVGVAVSVLPFVSDGPSWCEVTVDGKTVRQDQVDGRPAVCVWVRDAA